MWIARHVQNRIHHPFFHTWRCLAHISSVSGLR